MSPVLGRGMRLVGVGIVLRLAGGLAGARLMRTALFDVAPTGPTTFVGVPIGLALVELLACLIPGLGAMCIDASAALKTE